SLSMQLPQWIKWSMNGCVERLGDVAEALGEDVEGRSPRAAAERGIEAIRQILIDVGTHEPISRYGATEDDLEKLARDRVEMLPPNPLWPRPSPTAEDLVGIWRKAL